MRRTHTFIALLAALLLVGLPGHGLATGYAEIAAELSGPLYDMDAARVDGILRATMQAHPNVIALELHDSLINQPAGAAWRETDNTILVATGTLPPTLDRLVRHTTHPITKEELHIGNLTIYVKPVVTLNQEESSFLRHHPVVRVANIEWPPFAYRRNQEDAGYALDLFRLLAEKAGLRVEIHHGATWNDYLAMIRNDEIDVIPSIAQTLERSEYLIFTAPFITINDNVYVRRERLNEIRSMSDLHGRRVAVIEGTFEHDALRRYYPEILALPTGSASESLQTVASGDADAAIESDRVAEFIILRDGLGAIAPAFQARGPGFGLDLRMATSTDKSTLRDILQKALAAVTEQEFMELSSRWFMGTAPANNRGIILTPEEEAYRQTRGPVRFAVDPDFAPYEKLDSKGQYTGIASDLVKLISARSGLTFELVPTATWTDSLTKARRREVDVLPFLNQSPERSEYLIFTPPIYEDPEVIVARNDVTFLKGFESLHHRRTGIMRGWRSDEYTRIHHPEIEIVYIDEFDDALEQVSRGDLFAAVGSLGTVAHGIRQLRVGNIRISGDTLFQNVYRMGIRSDDLLLHAILSKTVESITPQEIDAIVNRWISITYTRDFNYRILWQIAATFLLILIIIGLWNWRLRYYNEQLREAKNKAELANRTKSEFIANMSHEIRTPLNAIIGFAELLANDIADQRQRQQAAVIATAGKSLLRLINDVLDISKIEAGKIDIVPEPVILREIFNDVKTFLAGRADARNLHLTFTARGPLPSMITVDAARVRQVLINLIGNAIKFTEKGGITVRTAWRETPGHTNRGTLMIDVIDTGIGIPDTFKPHVFKAFEQAPGQDHARYGGTGLGLAISRQLARLMHGDITVHENPEGPGTMFSVTLNAIVGDESTTPANPENAPGSSAANIAFAHKPAILIVDDDPINRSLLTCYLQPYNFPLLEAAEGQTALDTFLRLKPALVLTDLKMPGMDGQTLLQKIREAEAAEGVDHARRTPVVAITAAVGMPDVKTLQQSFDAFLNKPISRDKLLRTLALYIPLENPTARATTPAEPGTPKPPPVPTLDPELVEEATTVRRTLRMNQVKALADKLIATGTLNDQREVEEFGRSLNEAAAGFQIERVKQLIDQIVNERAAKGNEPT